MVQALITYAVVALAAGWTVWSMVLRGWMRRRNAAKPATGCGPDCACGD